jgi:hypothetical protein
MDPGSDFLNTEVCPLREVYLRNLIFRGDEPISACLHVAFNGLRGGRPERGIHGGEGSVTAVSSNHQHWFRILFRMG